MAWYSVGGKDYNLVMTVHAMEAIEKEFGDMRKALEKFRGGSRDVATIKAMFRILANAGRHAAKQPEDVTGDELDNLGLKGLNALAIALNAAMDESMNAETLGGGLADDDVADVYAEQLAEKEKNA